MANLVTSPEILPLIEPVLSDSDIVSIKNTSKILEYETAKKYNIELKFGVGGNHKESSSSDLLKRWSEYSKN